MNNLLPLAPFVFVVFAFLVSRLTQKKRRLPPGPRCLPLIGAAWDHPTKFEWLTYKKWAREYGSDIIYFHLFGTPTVILNSGAAAYDLLERRSSIYSHRPDQAMLNLVGWNKNMTFVGYGDYWRQHRRMFHEHFYPGAMPKYYACSSREAKKMLGSLLEQPEHFLKHLQRMAGSTIMETTFGIKVQPEDDPYIALAEEALVSLAAVGNPGSYIVDFIPILKYLPTWFPGAQFKRDATAWRPAVDLLFDKPLQFVKQGMMRGDGEPCIAASMLSKLDESQDNTVVESVIRNVTGTAYAGGTDTSVSTLWSFVLAMLLYPDAQKAAQAEIDRVVGPGRLPEHDDRDSLPYVTSIMKETLRWRPAAPLAAPHRLLVDDEYEGYHLTAGTIVIGNAWAILHDERTYPNLETFDPTRYLTAEGALNKHAPDPSEVFGFGRRICPGRYFAMDTIWIAIAHILATFDIEKPVDEAGRVVEPSGESTPGILVHPAPFAASFKPRSVSASALIQSASWFEQLS